MQCKDEAGRGSSGRQSFLLASFIVISNGHQLGPSWPPSLKPFAYWVGPFNPPIAHPNHRLRFDFLQVSACRCGCGFGQTARSLHADCCLPQAGTFNWLPRGPCWESRQEEGVQKGCHKLDFDSGRCRFVDHWRFLTWGSPLWALMRMGSTLEHRLPLCWDHSTRSLPRGKRREIWL